MNLKLKFGLSNSINIGKVGMQSGGASDTTAPTLTISCVSSTATVAAMQIVASEVVTGFAVGDITISAGGSLAGFATADNITFTVNWTLASGANTMDINAGVCTDAAGNNNAAATQYALTLLIVQTGADADIASNQPTTARGANTTFEIGERNDATAIRRALIKPTLSGVSAGATIYFASISINAVADVSSNARTYRVYRMLQSWVEAQVTWNVYSTGNNWPGGEGAFGASDCEQTDIGTRDFTATETVPEFKIFSLTPSKVQEMISGGVFTDNGFLIKADTETNDAYAFTAYNDGGATRPKLTVVFRP